MYIVSNNELIENFISKKYYKLKIASNRKTNTLYGSKKEKFC